MKRIAVFCDGTWNKQESQTQTNIVKLWQALARDDGAVEQVAIYIPGVGLIGGEDAAQIGFHDDRGDPPARPVISGLGEWLSQIGGGAFGWGLDDKVLTAYRFLAQTYEPGDQVYVFGFSRGAYTARTLLGLIRNCGLPDDPTPERLQFAITLYRSRLSYFAPNAYRMRRIREWLSPRVAVSKDDLAGRAVPQKSAVFEVAYLGLFDTVGALGVPGMLSVLAAVFNKKYRFHDTQMSSMVKSARHAISVDDQRVTYPPTLFDPDKLADLNARQGLEQDTMAQPYQEAWFPGVHGTVGGGVLDHERGLSNATLDWVMAGAEARGLVFDPEQRAGIRAGIDAMGPLRSAAKKESGVDRLTKRMFPYARNGRPYKFTLSTAARDRWLGDVAYAPKTLRKRLPPLGGQPRANRLAGAVSQG